MCWVTSFRCAFVNNVLLIRPNTKYRYSTIVFHYTLKYVSAVTRLNLHEHDDDDDGDDDVSAVQISQQVDV
jgi:hypothetical protein